MLAPLLKLTLPAAFPPHPQAVSIIAWSPDATYLASGDASGRLLVWSMRSGGVVRSMQVRGGALPWPARSRCCLALPCVLPQGSAAQRRRRRRKTHCRNSPRRRPLPYSLFLPFFPPAQAPSTVYDLRFNQDSSLLACCTSEAQPILVADLRRQG